MIEHILISAYQCDDCAVRGRDPDEHPRCWCCGQPAAVTARVRVEDRAEDKAPPEPERS